MTEDPLFSIITPAYECRGTIDRTIESVLAQTRDDWEHIVVDDGSTDGTAEVAAAYAEHEPRVRLVRRSNGGPGAARASGIAESRGQFVCLLDADDVYSADYLERQASFIETHPDRDIYSCNASCITTGGQHSLWREEPRFQQVTSLTVDDLAHENLILVMATVRKRAIEDVGGFRPLRECEDYDLWLRMLAAGARHIYQPSVLCTYHSSPDNLSSRFESMWRANARILVEDVAENDAVPARARETARSSARRYEAMADLVAMLAEPDGAWGRRDALRTTAAFEGWAKKTSGAVLAVVSPRLYVRLLAERRERSMTERYGTSRPPGHVTPHGDDRDDG